jgi:pyridoxal phosphate enzyme (YggS family)
MIADRLAHVKQRIAAACARSGRDPASVRLVAVSKLQPIELVREAWAAGQRDFGENYAQHLRDRARELADLDGIRWHAIGPLQTNKVKYVAAAATAFHALDRVEIAEELGKRRLDAPMPCFVEVNVAGEATKHGVAPAGLGPLLEQVRNVRGIDVVGLMTMPPEGEAEAARPWFRRLRELAAEHGLRELSMGTTEDFEVAVEEGATVVRVGRSIFGERG